MSVEAKFTGAFEFIDKHELRKALSEVNSFLQGEAGRIQASWDEGHEVRKNSVHIALHLSCPEADFLCFEEIVETLGEYALAGEVKGWREDDEGEELYKAENTDPEDEVAD